jgi:hypothetical protein
LQLTQHRCIDVQDDTDTLVKGFQDARWDGRHETSDNIADHTPAPASR